MHGFSTAAFEPEENRFYNSGNALSSVNHSYFSIKSFICTTDQSSSLSRARPLHCLGQRRHQQPLSRNCEYFPGRALARECQKGCGSAPLCWPPWFPWLVRPPHCFHRSIHSFSTGCQVAAYNDAYSQLLVRGAPHLPPHFRLLCLSPAPRVLALENSASIGRWCRAPCSGQ